MKNSGATCHKIASMHFNNSLHKGKICFKRQPQDSVCLILLVPKRKENAGQCVRVGSGRGWCVCVCGGGGVFIRTLGLKVYKYGEN